LLENRPPPGTVQMGEVEERDEDEDQVDMFEDE
jgi:segregation and condensation protein B